MRGHDGGILSLIVPKALSNSLGGCASCECGILESKDVFFWGRNLELVREDDEIPKEDALGRLGRERERRVRTLRKEVRMEGGGRSVSSSSRVWVLLDDIVVWFWFC